MSIRCILATFNPSSYKFARLSFIPFKISTDIDKNRFLFLYYLIFLLFSISLLGHYEDLDWSHVWSCRKFNWLLVTREILSQIFRIILINKLIMLRNVLSSSIQARYSSPCSSRTSSVTELPRKLRVIRRLWNFHAVRTAVPIFIATSTTFPRHLPSSSFASSSVLFLHFHS